MGFLKIGITPPDFRPDEGESIVTLLDEGIDIMHLRKPGCTVEAMEKLIRSIPESYHGRLRLHSHFELCRKYELRGVQVNSHEYVVPEGVTNISRSCHSVAELDTPIPSGCRLEYQTLSPIYDSISKLGYTSGFNLDELKGHLAGRNVVALGGVTPDKFPELQAAGFVGAAMLGCLEEYYRH